MTPERFERLRNALARRQPDLTVLLDNVHKPHNFSAIVRTCDAVGVFEAHAVSDKSRVRTHHDIASGSGQWVNIRTHPTLSAALETLETQGVQLLAAHLSQRAIDFRAVDYTRPTAIVLGAELHGISAQVLEHAHEHIIIPMHGLVASLNVSVAAAVILFEAQRQREQVGMYNECRLDTRAYERTLFEWAYPRLAACYRRSGIAYPQLDDDGAVVESDRHRRARRGG